MTGIEDVWPVAWLPNGSVAGAWADGPIAVPLKVTVCGLLASDANIVSVAVRIPRAPGVGENVTMALHEPLRAVRLNPIVQVVPAVTTLKSLAFAPLIDAAVVTAAVTETAVPVPLVSVTLPCPLVVLMRVLVNVRGFGLATTIGFEPVPDRVMPIVPLAPKWTVAAELLVTPVGENWM
jgi:hypothetical protein